MAYRSADVSGHDIHIKRFGRVASVEVVWSKEDLTANVSKELANVIPDWAKPMVSYEVAMMTNGAEIIGYFLVGQSGKITFKPTKSTTYVEGAVMYMCEE